MMYFEEEKDRQMPSEKKKLTVAGCSGKGEL